MDCHEFEELAGAYALGAVTPEEKSRADAHLAHCLQCQKLARELIATAHVLPLSVEPIPHSSLQKEALFARIRASEASRRGQPGPSQLRQPPARKRSWHTPLLAVAAVLLLALLAGMTAWNISLQHQLATQPAPPTVKVYTLQGLGQKQGISGEIIALPQQGTTTLIVHGLARLQGSHIYQGWLLYNKQPTSIGILSMDAEHDVALLRFPGDLKKYDTLAISLEPGPQASQAAPQGPVIAAGGLQKPTILESQLQSRYGDIVTTVPYTL